MFKFFIQRGCLLFVVVGLLITKLSASAPAHDQAQKHTQSLLRQESMKHSIPLVPFYFVRHGETDRNKHKIYQGSFDAPLNDAGLAQAVQAAEIIKSLKLTALVASPMLRARKTAEIIAGQRGGQEIAFFDALREVCLGELEGTPFGDHSAIHAWEAGQLVPSGAESYADFKERVRAAMQQVLTTVTGPLLIIGHARFYGALEDILGLRGTKKSHMGNCQVLYHTPPTDASGKWVVQETKGSGVEIKQVPFYFIRHGETDANKDHIFVGGLDVPLNENGIRQAHAAAEKLVGLPIATIVTSPLQRARVTAEIIGARLGKPVIEIKGLQEWCAGELEGKPLMKSLRERVKDGPIAGAEDFAAYHARIAAALNEVLALQGPVLVVAHGGVHQVIQEALGIPVSKIANATPFFHQPSQSLGGAWTMDEVIKS